MILIVCSGVTALDPTPPPPLGKLSVLVAHFHFKKYPPQGCHGNGSEDPAALSTSVKVMYLQWEVLRTLSILCIENVYIHGILIPNYFIDILNSLTEKSTEFVKRTSKHIRRSTNMCGRNLTLAFAMALIAAMIKFPLVHVAFVFALIIALRICFCCLRQPIQDTSIKFKDEAFPQHEDDACQVETTTQMIFRLSDEVASSCKVGGKAANLMKLHGNEQLSMYVPNGFVLSVAFFQPWIDAVTTRVEWKVAEQKILSRDMARTCAQQKNIAKILPLSEAQAEVLSKLREAIDSWPGLYSFSFCNYVNRG